VLIPVETLSLFLAVSALLSLSPGPDNIYVLTQSALFGARIGLLITLGLCSGLIVHTAAVALGLAAFIQTSSWAYTLLKLLGAAYLLFLAWQSYQASANQLILAAQARLSGKAFYQRGIIMNLSNPKVGLFFLAFLPQFTDAQNGSLLLQFFLLGLLFILVALIIFSLIAFFADLIGQWLKQSARAQTIMHRLTSLVLVLLALRLVYE
jgi:threonine/homoserine/homoserine lactone efflux protein